MKLKPQPKFHRKEVALTVVTFINRMGGRKAIPQNLNLALLIKTKLGMPDLKQLSRSHNNSDFREMDQWI